MAHRLRREFKILCLTLAVPRVSETLGLLSSVNDLGPLGPCLGVGLGVTGYLGFKLIGLCTWATVKGLLLFCFVFFVYYFSGRANLGYYTLLTSEPTKLNVQRVSKKPMEESKILYFESFHPHKNIFWNF